MEIKEGTWVRKGDFHYYIRKIDLRSVTYTRHGGKLGSLTSSIGRVSFAQLVEGGETVQPPNVGVSDE